MKRCAMLIAMILPLAACHGQPEPTPQTRAPAVEVLGEPVDCLLTSRVRDTVVHDDYTIDFRLTGGEVYRNTLPNRCPQLGFEERFSYEVSSGNLCAIDQITVIHSGAGSGPRCGLGQFVPVRLVDAASGG